MRGHQGEGSSGRGVNGFLFEGQCQGVRVRARARVGLKLGGEVVHEEHGVEGSGSGSC